MCDIAISKAARGAKETAARESSQAATVPPGPTQTSAATAPPPSRPAETATSLEELPGVGSSEWSHGGEHIPS